jgi:L-aspartate oxidase
MCGGILVDKHGKSWINRLYAVGETACTGLHGANRLASNSLLEAIVYAERAAKHTVTCFKDHSIQEGIPEWNEEGTSHPEEMILITQNYKEVQQIMTNYVGIVRSELRLERAARRLEIIFQETEDLYKKSSMSKELCELRNLIHGGYLVIKSAQARKESCGLHFMLDHPKTR